VPRGARLGTALTVRLPDAAAGAADRSVGGAFGAAAQFDAACHSGLADALREAASKAFFDGFEAQSPSRRRQTP
jgi:hypothetical protein